MTTLTTTGRSSTHSLLDSTTTGRESASCIYGDGPVVIDIEEPYAPLARSIIDQQGLTIQAFRKVLQTDKNSLAARKVILINRTFDRPRQGFPQCNDYGRDTDLFNLYETATCILFLFGIAGAIAGLSAGLVFRDKSPVDCSRGGYDCTYPYRNKSLAIGISVGLGTPVVAFLARCVLYLGLKKESTRRLEARERVWTNQNRRDIEEIDKQISVINRLLEELVFDQPQENSVPIEVLSRYAPYLEEKELQQFNYTQRNQMQDLQSGGSLSEENRFIFNKISMLRKKSAQFIIDNLKRIAFLGEVKEHPMLFVGIVQHLPEKHLNNPKVMDVLINVYQQAFLEGDKSEEALNRGTILKLASTPDIELLKPAPEQDLTIRACSSSAPVSRRLLQQKSGLLERETIDDTAETLSLSEFVPKDMVVAYTNFINTDKIDLSDRPIIEWIRVAKNTKTSTLTELCRHCLMNHITSYETGDLLDIYAIDPFEDLMNVVYQKLLVVIQENRPTDQKFVDAVDYAKNHGVDNLLTDAKSKMTGIIHCFSTPILSKHFNDELKSLLQLNTRYQLDLQGHLMNYAKQEVKRVSGKFNPSDSAFIDEFDTLRLLNTRYKLNQEDTLIQGVFYSFVRSPEKLAELWTILPTQPDCYEDTVKWLRGIVLSFCQNLDNKKTLDKAWVSIPDDLHNEL